MSVKYEIRQQIREIKWLCRNNLITSDDKLTPIYDAIEKIENELDRL